MRTYKWLLLTLCIAVTVLTTSCAKLQSRDQMNQGVQAYRNNHYPDAVRHFKEAVRLDPTNQNAQLFLATSYFTQWVPGAESPDNKKNYDMAKQEFQNVLSKDPTNSLALASMAAMAYNSATGGTPEQKVAALEDARKWNQRRIEANPKEAEPYYYLGVIDYAEALGPISTARVDEKLKADNPGPLPDMKVRSELDDKYEKLIDSGIDNLKKNLSLDKENEDAMSYINLLLREKAALASSPEEAKALSSQADEWMNKSLDMKRIKASRPQKSTEAS